MLVLLKLAIFHLLKIQIFKNSQIFFKNSNFVGVAQVINFSLPVLQVQRTVVLHFFLQYAVSKFEFEISS